jgi:hypothetical protein
MISNVTLWSLPPELQQQIVQHLDRGSLISFSSVNRQAWNLAIEIIWRHVSLIDCRSEHEAPEDEQEKWKEHSKVRSSGDGRMIITDEHDDTPFIGKLLVLAK